MTSKEKIPQESFLSRLLNQLSPEQQLANQKEIESRVRAESWLDSEQYYLRLLERRRQSVENLPARIDRDRRLKLYEDFDSVFEKMFELLNLKRKGDIKVFNDEWDLIRNKYIRLQRREKFYAEVGQQQENNDNKPNSKSHKIFGETIEIWGLSINYKNLWHKIRSYVAIGFKAIGSLIKYRG